MPMRSANCPKLDERKHDGAEWRRAEALADVYSRRRSTRWRSRTTARLTTAIGRHNDAVRRLISFPGCQVDSAAGRAVKVAALPSPRSAR